MMGFQPVWGFASFTKLEEDSVKQSNGLLIPTQKTESTLIKGTLTSVNDPDETFCVGDTILVSAENIHGIYTENGVDHHIVKVFDLLGKVVSA